MRRIRHFQLCSPGQRSTTFPTDYELCIVQERGTGAALHGDETGCSSRQPAEPKDSHQENRNIPIAVIFEQKIQDGSGRSDAPLTELIVPPLLQPREESDRSWTRHLLVPLFTFSPSYRQAWASNFPSCALSWRNGSPALLSPSALVNYSNDLSPSVCTKESRRDYPPHPPCLRTHKPASILTNSTPA